MRQIIFSNAAELCLGDIGLFGASLELSLRPWAQQEPPPCPCVSQSHHVRAQVALSDPLGCCGEMGFLKSSYFCRTLVFIPHLLNSSPWKQLFCVLCNTTSPTDSCRNLICKQSAFIPLSAPPFLYQTPHLSISITGHLLRRPTSASQPSLH